MITRQCICKMNNILTKTNLDCITCSSADKKILIKIISPSLIKLRDWLQLYQSNIILFDYDDVDKNT